MGGGAELGKNGVEAAGRASGAGAAAPARACRSVAARPAPPWQSVMCVCPSQKSLKHSNVLKTAGRGFHRHPVHSACRTRHPAVRWFY